MALKFYKPVTPGRRGMSGLKYRELLSGDKPLKALTKGKRSFGGRSSNGRVSVRHQGGGHKKSYRDIDFKYNKKDITARIATIEYDPFRSAFIGVAVYADGEKRYVTLPKTTKVGDTFMVSENAPVKTGNRLPLGKLPVGTFVYNVEVLPGQGGIIARSAGNYAEVVAHDGGYSHLKMPSTEIRRFIETAWASVGEVSNDEHRLVNYGKAGRTRWKGVKPTVRGTAMNPVDHPHGGGEGRQGRGRRRAISMWGKPTGKGQKSRRPKKPSKVFILARRKVGKRK
jgi:large subunit ribosomal protein L2